MKYFNYPIVYTYNSRFKTIIHDPSTNSFQIPDNTEFRIRQVLFNTKNLERIVTMQGSLAASTVYHLRFSLFGGLCFNYLSVPKQEFYIVKEDDDRYGKFLDETDYWHTEDDILVARIVTDVTGTPIIYSERAGDNNIDLSGCAPGNPSVGIKIFNFASNQAFYMYENFYLSSVVAISPSAANYTLDLFKTTQLIGHIIFSPGMQRANVTTLTPNDSIYFAQGDSFVIKTPEGDVDSYIRDISWYFATYLED